MEPRSNPIHDDMLLEVLKHLDAFSLARVSCVSKQWCAVARHEKLWESLCILHWPANAPPKRNRRSRSTPPPLAPPAPCSPQQIRSVVESLGGFRRFFLLHLGPMLKRTSHSSIPISSTSSSSNSIAASNSRSRSSRWGRDEVNLSLSLYSIECFLRPGIPGTSSLKRKISSLD